MPQIGLSLNHTIPTFYDPQGKRRLGTILGKGENAGNQYSPFPKMFSTLPNTKFKF